MIYADKLILVEGPSEEMLIRTYINLDRNNLSGIEVISVAQKGYKTFLDIWLRVNKNNKNKKIGIVRDFDDQENAQKEHEEYRSKHPFITIETTTLYTLEDDIAHNSNNTNSIAEYFSIPLDADHSEDADMISKFLKDDKTGGMLSLCDAMSREASPLVIELPSHIIKVLEALK